MRKGNRYDRHRLCAFAGFDGKTYDALVIPRRAGMVKVDYMIQTEHGHQLVTAYLDRHEAKARLTQAGYIRMGLLGAFAGGILIAAVVFLIARGLG